MAGTRKKAKKVASKPYTSFDVYLKDMEPTPDLQKQPSEYYLLGSRAVESAVVEFQEQRGLTNCCR